MSAVYASGPHTFTCTLATDSTGYTDTVRFPQAGNFIGAEVAVANVSVRLSVTGTKDEATGATVKVSATDSTIDASTADTDLMYVSANTTGITGSATASFVDDTPLTPLWVKMSMTGGPALAVQVTAAGGGGGTSEFNGAVTFLVKPG